MKKLMGKDKYDIFCHNTRNALVCLSYSAKKLENMLDEMDIDLDTADNLLVCIMTIRRELKRIDEAILEITNHKGG